MLDTELEPFTTAIPPGTYPVTLAVIRFEEQPAHERVAAAKLIVHKEPVVSWELALCPGEDPRLLGDGEFFGFGVDTGTASLLDAAALSAMVGLVTDDAWEALSIATGTTRQAQAGGDARSRVRGEPHRL